MIFTICSHSLYESQPKLPLDDISTQDFNRLSKSFHISFDDGYRSIYSIGRKLFNDLNNKIYIFINTDFIERPSTIWWFELYDYIKLNDTITFTKKSKEYNYTINTKKEKSKVYKYLSYIFKYQLKHHQEDLLTDIKGTKKRNNYQELFMTWNMVKELSELKNVIIGSHTCLHQNLKLLTKDLVKHELELSREILEIKLNRSIYDVAIPFGDENSFSKRDLEITSDIGYRYIFTTVPNLFSVHNKFENLIIVNRICTRIGYNNKYLIFIRFFIKSIIYVFSRFNNHYL